LSAFDLFRQGRLRHGTIENTVSVRAWAGADIARRVQPSRARASIFASKLFARAVGERDRQHIERIQRESIPMRRIAWRRARPPTAPVDAAPPRLGASQRWSGEPRPGTIDPSWPAVFCNHSQPSEWKYGLIEDHPIRFALASLQMIVGWSGFFALAVRLERYR
jgi:hypothetical protein